MCALRLPGFPCLNLVGRKSGVFPWQGTAVVGNLIPKCHTVCHPSRPGCNKGCVDRGRLPEHFCLSVQVYFESANHWLYLEEPDKFNALLREFVVNGLPAVCKSTSV